MTVRNIEDIYPLSPMQQGMLFESLLAPESGVYVELSKVTLRGSLDVDAFRRAWQAVLDRHSILRSAFIAEDIDEPLQVVYRGLELPFRYEDWRDVPAAERDARLDRLLADERTTGFDLADAPLMRVALLRTADDTHTLVWTHHHILLDGWSQPQLLHEVMVLYEGYRQGREVRLDPPKPYRDYIAWLNKQDMAAAEAYWRRVLAGFTAPTPLAIEGLGVAEDDPAYGEMEIHLPRETTALQALAAKQHVTMSTIAQGAWALLLSRYSGEDDVVFGVTVSGRPADLPGAESMIGLFINTLPVRVRVNPEAVVADWLKELQVQAVEMRQYEYSPLVEVQRWSDVEPGQPLFKSILVFENFPVAGAMSRHEGDLRIEDVRFIEQTEFPLTFVSGVGDEMLLKIVYDGRVVSRDTVARILGHVATLLEGMAASPDSTLADLPLLTGAERQQVLVEWNRTDAPYPADQCAHELFEEQAARTPDAPALVFEGETMSYAELNRRANRLAHTLRERGIGPETLVGVAIDRSFDMIVAVLGIMKAGAAYLPLDPSYPLDRLGYIIGDSRIRLLITHAALADRLPDHEADVLRLDADWPQIERAPAGNPENRAVPGSLAYAIYTSGSTGQPKGSLLEHRGLTNLSIGYADALGIGPGSRVLQFFSFGFDGSLLEIFPALTHGATLVLARRDTLLSPAELRELMRAERISHSLMPPAMLSVLPPGDLPDLKVLVSGGDALLPEVAARWLGDDRRVINAYGPTETTVCVALHEVTEADVRAGRIPIGRPLQNVRLYVLDAQGCPVPVGVPGELHVGGIAVGRGYLDRPDLNAEKFVRDPFSDTPGARMYRTGDLARWLPDGNIDFLGRTDFQVKIRGYRVELGEIENALTAHPTVKQAVVKALREGAGEAWLAAYIIPEGGALPEPAALREFLLNTLPEYMVPAAYVVLDEFPLSPAGKVDRRALPAPDGARLVSAEYVAPRTPVEGGLAAIYASVLKVERVGAYDSFFALGGHSLLATQLVSRVRETFQVDLPLRTLFEAPTVAELASRVEQALREDAGLGAPPLAPVEFEGDPPVSFAQARLWFLDQLAPGNLFYNIPLAVRLSGPPNVDALRRSLQEIVRRHEALRTTFRAEKGEPVQVIADALALELPLNDLTSLPKSEREAVAQRLAEQDARTPFDLAAGPLLRARLIRLAEDEHLAVVVVHHIIADGWSMNVLAGELGRLYAAFVEGKPSPLPDLPVQYADYAHWQREWLQGEVLERQLAYWRKQLEGTPALLELPTDRPRPAVQSWNGATYNVMLPPELAAQVRELAQDEGATLFMVLLAAFQALLSRYSGQTDISVGTAIAGRGRPEVEGLIGFFVNTLVMRTDLSGEPSFKELVARVKEVALGAYAHQDVPFEMLAEKLQPRRNLSHTPFFQVMFVLNNAPRGAVELGGVTLSPVEVDRGTSTFDLTLQITDTEQGFACSLEYNSDLFERGTVERLMAHYRRLLEAAVAEPERPVAELPLLTEAERQQMLVEWNRTDAPYPQQTVHALFAGWAEQQPDEAALVFGKRVLTYRELNERANQLAHALRERGVGPETVVGIAVERSFEMLVGVLGVLKAGGAYLPVDPTYPAGRIAFMLADSGVRLLLTQAHLVERLPEHAAETLRLDADWDMIASRPATNPDVPLTPDALAYVIYTSGSTGQPKGVLLAHRGLANLAAAQREVFGVGPGKRVLQFAPFSFDASVWETVMALANGATLVLAEQATLASGPDLLRLLAAQRVNVVTLPPSLLAVLEPGELPELEVVVAAGERCTEAIVAAWSPGRRLFNAYGPTETTVCASWYECADEEPGGPPIGRALPNVRLYVLDSRGQPVPVGVAGELHVGGVGLARGYLNRPELTAEKFIPNPFGEGGRLYRTGDLVRWLPDGNLEFLGRIDHQVKLRGFRIELGEIEAALRAQPEVADAVVLAHEDRLVAYLVPAGGAEPQPVALRAALRQRLPEYMVPAQYVMLERFPMTPANKVDRAALPKPDGERPVLTSKYVAPRTPTEEKLAEIAAELLGLEKVGVYDDFFELGGHSLLATQLMARVREAFGVEVPLRALFETPHLAGLAEAVDELKAQGPAPEMPAIVPLARERYRTSRMALARGGNGMSEPEAEKDATRA